MGRTGSSKIKPVVCKHRPRSTDSLLIKTSAVNASVGRQYITSPADDVCRLSLNLGELTRANGCIFYYKSKPRPEM